MRPSLAAHLLGGIATVALLCGFGGREPTSEARRDANRYILEKLNRQTGEGWQRSGQYFLWRYQFSKDGCELRISRESVIGSDLLMQTVPIADVVPVWQGGPSVELYCQSSNDCIELETRSIARDSQSQRVGDTSLLVPQPDDLPKLTDALAELHRLCDDPYAR